MTQNPKKHEADIVEKDAQPEQDEADIVEKEAQPKPDEADIVDPGHVVMQPAAEIYDAMKGPMSPGSEIGENGSEADNSQVSEVSTSILPTSVEMNIMPPREVILKQNSEKKSTVQTNEDKQITCTKPLVDYDDTFTEGTPSNNNTNEVPSETDDSDVELPDDILQLSEIPTSQLDTSLPSETELSSEEDGKTEEKKVKTERNKGRKNKRLGNTGIVKKVKIMEKETTDNEDETKDTVDEVTTKKIAKKPLKIKLKEPKDKVRKRKRKSAKSKWTTQKKRTVCTKAVEEESEKEDEMIQVSAVKMGCNKCIAVFYSQGAYHDNLSKRHRIKNFDKYPPTIISKLWKKIPAIPTMSEEEQAKRPFHCSACTSKFFTSDALDTHENLCYKASIEVKESQARIMYECLAKEEEEKGDGEKKDNDGVQRESRSHIPKKKETASRKERVKGSKSKSEERRSRSKSRESHVPSPDADISESENKSEISDSENTDKDKSVKRKKNIKSKDESKIEEDKSKDMSITDTTKNKSDPKTFNKKPPPKRYPLRNNKEVEEAEEILNKYKTINQAKDNEMKDSESAETVDTTVEPLDNTDLDADYSPEQGNNSTSISSIETPKLPKMVRR